jgi:hypothetical protein
MPVRSDAPQSDENAATQFLAVKLAMPEVSLRKRRVTMPVRAIPSPALHSLPASPSDDARSEF